MTRCPCGALHQHPTSHECAFCAGRACAVVYRGVACGKSKQPTAETCGRPLCVALARAAKPKPAANVTPYRARKARVV